MQEVLSAAAIRQFIKEGFVRIDNAFSPGLAAEVRRRLWRDIPADPADPSTWTRPVVRLGMYSESPFIESCNTGVLHAAFDQLVGQGRWLPCGSMGTFPVRFPSTEDPGDTGWHVDVSFGDSSASFFEWRANWRSKNRALLMLFLYSDVGENDAPTRIKVGSHLDVARLLRPYAEEGLSLMEIVGAMPMLPARGEVVATGRAGTVYLCHPLLLHAAQRHDGREPRFLAQPPLLLNGELMESRDVASYSPVELAIHYGVNG